MAATSIDAYIAAEPEAVRKVLERVRAAILKAIPDAEEVISYGIPAVRVAGRVAIFFAGWKEHWSLYPASQAVVSALAEDLAPYAVSKGTIRFPLGAPVPVRLVQRIARIRADETRAAARAAAEKKKTKKKSAPA